MNRIYMLLMTCKPSKMAEKSLQKFPYALKSCYRKWIAQYFTSYKDARRTAKLLIYLANEGCMGEYRLTGFEIRKFYGNYWEIEEEILCQTSK